MLIKTGDASILNVINSDSKYIDEDKSKKALADAKEDAKKKSDEKSEITSEK